MELDGTENWSWNTSTAWAYIATFLPNNKTGVAPVCSHYQGTGAVIPAANQVAINELGSLIIKDPSWKSVDDAKAYLAAQKAAGTPVQIAYQLATPETYATDPVDFDNTAGPLTVMTGGEVVVRMTELVGSRSPELAGKMDKATYDADGDGVVDRAAVADKVAKKLILQNNAGQQMAEFDGSEEKTVKLTPAQVGAEPTFTKNSAFNKNFGTAAGTVCQGNDGRLSNARRASNISMSLSGTTLTINYS